MILALDVGFSNTGWAIVDKGEPVACGVIKTLKNADNLPKSKFKVTDDNIKRCITLSRGLLEIIEQYKPSAVVGEMPTGGSQSSNAATQMAMATAVVAVTVAIAGLPCAWTSPTAGKKAMTGLRGAEKDQMMEACRLRWASFPWPKVKAKFEHIADAMASYLALGAHPLVTNFG